MNELIFFINKHLVSMNEILKFPFQKLRAKAELLDYPTVQYTDLHSSWQASVKHSTMIFGYLFHSVISG